jgi:hypothetical protein
MEGHLKFLWEAQQYFSSSAVNMSLLSHHDFGVIRDRRPIFGK